MYSMAQRHVRNGKIKKNFIRVRDKYRPIYLSFILNIYVFIIIFKQLRLRTYL